MAKVKAPLLGFSARGQLGKSAVFAEWKGVQYARQHTVPANPRTAEQVKTRDVFTFLNDYWRMAPSAAKEPWAAFAKGKPLTDRNALLSYNISILRTATDLTDFIASPGTGSAPPLSGLTATTGAASGELNASATIGTLPTGWTLQKVVFVAVPNIDPHMRLTQPVAVIEDTTAPYSASFTGLAPATEYIVAAWGVFQKPDGTIVYGPSINAAGTTG